MMDWASEKARQIIINRMAAGRNVFSVGTYPHELHADIADALRQAAAEERERLLEKALSQEMSCNGALESTKDDYQYIDGWNDGLKHFAAAIRARAKEA